MLAYVPDSIMYITLALQEGMQYRTEKGAPM